MELPAERVEPGHLVVEDSLNDVGIPVPSVVLRGGDGGPDRLEWSPGAGDATSGPVRGCLNAFLRLDGGDSDAIGAFARTWGVLGICPHGLPGIHDGCRPLGVREQGWSPSGRMAVEADMARQRMERESYPQGPTYFDRAGEIPGAFPENDYWEPIAAWRRYARMFRALLSIAVDLSDRKLPDEMMWREGQPFTGVEGQVVGRAAAVGSLPDWEAAYDPRSDLAANVLATVRRAFSEWDDRRMSDEPRHKNEIKAAQLTEAGRRLAGSLQLLVAHAGIVPHATWDGDRSVVVYRMVLGGPSVPSSKHWKFPWPPNGLFSVLVSQLLTAVQRPNGVFRCTRCANVFIPPGNKPASNRPVRCPACVEVERREGKKEYQSDYRANGPKKARGSST